MKYSYLLKFFSRPQDSKLWDYGTETMIELDEPITEAIADEYLDNFRYHYKVGFGDHCYSQYAKVEVFQLTKVDFDENT